MFACLLKYNFVIISLAKRFFLFVGLRHMNWNIFGHCISKSFFFFEIPIFQNGG